MRARTFILFSACLLMSNATSLLAQCGVQITDMRVIDPPTQTSARIEVDYSFVGQGGTINIERLDDYAYAGGGNFGPGTGTAVGFTGYICIAPGAHTYGAIASQNCGGTTYTTERTVTRDYDPRPTADGHIVGFNPEKTNMTTSVHYRFPYVSPNSFSVRVIHVYVDGAQFSERWLNGGEPWEGTVELTNGGLGCRGSGTHEVTYVASVKPFGNSISCWDSPPAAPDPVNIKQALITGITLDPIDGAGNVHATIGYAFEGTGGPAFLDRSIYAYFSGSQVSVTGNLNSPSGTVESTFNVGCRPPGTYRFMPKAVTCPTAINVSTPTHYEFAYTPPDWVRTITFQASLDFCNGHVDDVTTVECPSVCKMPQPPTGSSHPISYEDGNAHYSDSDPLPLLLDAVRLNRNYDSHQRIRGSFGRGWVSIFDSRLFVLAEATGDTISMTDENNESFVFMRRNGVYTQMWPKGRTSAGTLAFDAMASLYVHRPAGAGTARLYRSSDGRFVGLRDISSGREVRITYDANGLPQSVKDSWTDVTWNVTVNAATKRVTAIETAGLTWQYSYVNDNLIGVLAPGSSTWRTYEYTNDRLTAAKDALGNLIEGHTYDAYGRTMSESGARDEIDSIQYGAAGTSSTQLVTRITMKSGVVSEFTLRPIGGSWRTVSITGRCTACSMRRPCRQRRSNRRPRRSRRPTNIRMRTGPTNRRRLSLRVSCPAVPSAVRSLHITRSRVL